MSQPIPVPGRGRPNPNEQPEQTLGRTPPSLRERYAASGSSRSSYLSSTPPTPGLLSRSSSFTNSIAWDEDELDGLPPLDRLTVFDFLENFALPQRLEKLQASISAQTDKVRKQQERLKSTSKIAKERVVDEWKKRIPPADEKLDKYRRRVRDSVDRLGKRWNDPKGVTTREKLSFISSVLNIFISGYLVGAFPEFFHYWYTAQLLYFFPIRFYTYRKRGYHYFLADLCYFVNLLLLISIWAFPNSKRLFISTYCLAFGNNAVAIAMWRNALVFHSLDKVTRYVLYSHNFRTDTKQFYSLFIHIMPCVTLHCLVHLIPESFQASRFPAIHSIKTSLPDTPEHYTLSGMMIWATFPYAVWQLSYHFLITVRRREQIAAGRPTSFTWLRKSYAPTWLGKLVLSLPESLQEPAFMGIQYCYALLTMVPAPLWFWSRVASALFLFAIFTISIHSGATYYISFFGKRYLKELEQLKKDMARLQMSPEIGAKTPLATPGPGLDGEGQASYLSLGVAMGADGGAKDVAVQDGPYRKGSGAEGMPVRLDPSAASGLSTGVEGSGVNGVTERKL